MSETEIKKVDEQAAPVAATEAAPAAAEEKTPASRKSSIINASVKPEDFDWDAFEGGEGNSAEDRKAIEEAYDKTLSKVVENEVVEGEVTALTKREVVVNSQVLGQGERGLRERRDRQGLRQDPHQGRHDRGRVRNRGVPARFADRHQAHP